MQDFSPATDVYGLAATLFYLLTSKNPPEASIVLNEGIGEKPMNVSDTVWHAIEQGLNPRKKDRVQAISEFLNLMNCMMPTFASEVLTNQEETQVSPQKLSGNLVDAHEQTIVAPKKEENVEYIDEEDNTSNSRKIIFVILAVLVIGCVYAFVKCQGNNEAIEKTAQNIETTVEENVQKQGAEQDVNDEQQNCNTPQDSQEKVYDVVEVMPSFPGGQSALMQYLGNNIQYPVEAQENGVQGRVIISFVVDKDGSISHVKVAKSADSALDREAVRVVESMPKWIPGKQNGECVRVRYSVPVVFRLE